MVEGEWNTDFTDELSVFPNGEHDDQVDAVSILYDMTKQAQTLLYA